jgi:MraZ protein
LFGGKNSENTADLLFQKGAGVMETMSSFSATSDHTLDAKNRIFIPLKFREKLGDTIYILRQRSDDGNCLHIYTKEAYEAKAKMYNEMEAKALTPEELESATRTARRFFFFIDDVPFDSKGRITLKPLQLEHAGIEKDAVIIGMGDQFEIWSRANWEKYMGF